MSDPIASAIAAAVEERIAARLDALEMALAQRSAPAEQPALLDRAGLARALCTSPSTVDRMRAEGMPELRLCDAPRFELPAVLAWLRERSAE